MYSKASPIFVLVNIRLTAVILETFHTAMNNRSCIIINHCWRDIRFLVPCSFPCSTFLYIKISICTVRSKKQLKLTLISWTLLVHKVDESICWCLFHSCTRQQKINLQQSSMEKETFSYKLIENQRMCIFQHLIIKRRQTLFLHIRFQFYKRI